jgi:hypothetical protein
MNMKSILLGTAAGLMVASAASAADLPGEAVPAAVDYVKVCDAFGTGFFYIPGTETCLDISGEVKVSTKYLDLAGTWTTKASANASFDARTATELGTLRSFFKIKTDDGGDVVADAAFIQLSYLVVGRTGSVFNGDTLYGEFDGNQGWGFFKDDGLVAQIIVDDLGGGFYVKAGLEEPGVWTVTNPDDVLIAGAVGVAGQPWGGVDLSIAYDTGIDEFQIKGTADLAFDPVKARLFAAYDSTGADEFLIGAAVGYDAGAADPYAGLSYAVNADTLRFNAGLDYAIVDGLTATAEIKYDVNPGADDLGFYAALKRTW